jgi:hypothetical protein
MNRLDKTIEITSENGFCQLEVSYRLYLARLSEGWCGTAQILPLPSFR